MTVRNKRIFVCVTVLAMALTFGMVGRSFADEIDPFANDTDMPEISIAMGDDDESDSTDETKPSQEADDTADDDDWTLDDDCTTPMIDLFGGDDDDETKQDDKKDEDKKDEDKKDDKQDGEKADEISCETVYDFDGVKFTYALSMKNLQIAEDGTGSADYRVESWVGDDKAALKVEQPTAKDCDGVALQQVSPKDLLSIVHFRVYYKDAADPIVSIDTNAEAELMRRASDQASAPLRSLTVAGYGYANLMSHYIDAKNGKQVDTTGDDNLKATFKDIVVPQEHEAKVLYESSVIEKTTFGLEYGETANLRYYFTPAAGYKAKSLQFMVDGEVVSIGKKIVHAETGATIMASVQSDGRVLLKIAGIKPADFGRRFTVAAGAGTNMKVVSNSALSNAYANQGKENLGDVCRTLYAFNLAAEAYLVK